MSSYIHRELLRNGQHSHVIKRLVYRALYVGNTDSLIQSTGISNPVNKLWFSNNFFLLQNPPFDLPFLR